MSALLQMSSSHARGLKMCTGVCACVIVYICVHVSLCIYVCACVSCGTWLRVSVCVA